jgi:hypothetical protein
MDNVFTDFVEVAVGVCCFVPWGSVGFFVEDGVLVSVNGGINTCSLI